MGAPLARNLHYGSGQQTTVIYIMKPSPLLCAVSAATLMFSAFAASELNAQNLVADPGFEASTNNPTGGNPFSSAWTLVEPNGLSVVGGNPSLARTGNNYANLAPDIGATGSLSQILTTTAGSVYTLSFWLGNDVAGTTAFEVFWNGASVLSLTNLAVQPSGQLYTNYTVSNLSATGPNTTLEFRYRHDDDFFRLDDISVVPEPSTISFAVLGLGIFGAVSYRRSKLRRSGAR
jgi:hypothetical protein